MTVGEIVKASTPTVTVDYLDYFWSSVTYYCDHLLNFPRKAGDAA